MKIKLELWLQREFEPAPAIRTARRWIKEGRIFPAPVKIGNAYYVDQMAVFQEPTARPRLVHRIAHGS